MAKDLFSKQSSGYASFRPGYPEELFAYIFQYVKEKGLAWDCATGNGQAAVFLSRHFKQVIATDISSKQLEHAIEANNIRYSAFPESNTDIEPSSVDLITIAQAYHWLNFDAFRKEAERVAKPGAIVAVWGYGLLSAADRMIREKIRHFYKNITGPYWDKERRYIDEAYRTIPFPFKELPSASFSIHREWAIGQLEGFLNTWSAIQHFIKAEGYNPVDRFIGDLSKVWNGRDTIAFEFPVFLRLGKI